jgi:hypothetical protein
MNHACECPASQSGAMGDGPPDCPAGRRVAMLLRCCPQAR